MNLVDVRSSLYGNTDQVKEIFKKLDLFDFDATPQPVDQLVDGQKKCCALYEKGDLNELISDLYYRSEGFLFEGEEINESFGSGLYQVMDQDDFSQMVSNSMNQSYSTLYELIDEDDFVRFVGVVPKVGLLPLGNFDMESSDMKSVVTKVISDFIGYSSIQKTN